MAIKVIHGNIFTSTCQTLVNPVNCVGVMGAGIALEYKLRYRQMFQRYQELCDKKQLDIGKLWIYKSSAKWILNFPTKRDWKHPTKLEYLELGLQKFVDSYKNKGILSAAFPLLGAGRGGVEAATSLAIMKYYLSGIDIDVEIYKYDPHAKDDLFDRTKALVLRKTAEELSSATGLRIDYVRRVMDGLNQSNIVQLNQLLNLKGIGEVTLEKIFDFSQEGTTCGSSSQSNLDFYA